MVGFCEDSLNEGFHMLNWQIAFELQLDSDGDHLGQKVPPFPEDIKIIDKIHTKSITSRGQPGVHANQPAEMPYSTAICGNWSRNIDFTFE